LSFPARNGWQKGCFQRGSKIDPDQGSKARLKARFAVRVIFGKNGAVLQRIWFGFPAS
jgi:hypothetical protein